MKKVEQIANDIVKLNLDKRVIDKFTCFVICLYTFLIMIPEFFYEVFENFAFERIFYTLYGMFMVPLIYIFIHNIKNKEHKKGIDFILITLFVIIAFISTLHSFNPYLALVGNDGRKDGFIALLIYYLLYANVRNIKDNKLIMRILDIFFIYGIVSTGFAFLEVYLPNTIFTAKHYIHMGYGLQANPNFFGSYTLLLTLLGLYISLFIKKDKFYIISTIIIYCGLVMSESTGPFITFIFMLFCLIIYILIKRRDLINKMIIYLIIFISMFFIVNYSLIYVNKNIYNLEVEDRSTISGDIKSLSETLLSYFNSKNNNPNNNSNNIVVDDSNIVYEINKVSSLRLMIWENVVEYVKKDNNIWLGAGPDNLSIYYIADHDENGVHFFNIDKAHNIYLNILAETGIFSLIVYIMWIIVLHLKGIKEKNMYINLLLFGLIGYNIQGLYNINVIYVVPYYYIIAGMLIGLKGDNNETGKH